MKQKTPVPHNWDQNQFITDCFKFLLYKLYHFRMYISYNFDVPGSGYILFIPDFVVHW